MNFRPNMTSVTSGIELAAPLIWRELPGVVADIWQVNVGRGSTGSYSAPDPRIVAVLDSGDSEMRLANGTSLRSQPVRIAFIPAGVPTRSGFRRSGRLAHLDVHFSAAELGARLRGTGLGSGPDPATEIAALLRAPRLLAASPPLQAMAGRMAEEIRAASFSHDALDGILGEMIATLFGPGVDAPPACPGGLTLGQLSRIDRLMREELHRPLSVAEMAGAIGLSDSWFAHAWSQSRGEPPHRSLQRLRIERAKTLLLQGEQSLAAIALDAGFADQAHFTRSFRRLAGQTPGLWRRQRRPADDR